MRSIDLNADLGEEITDDQALLAVVTSANVACGYHAGTPQIMARVCAEAVRRGVAVGAQVSYADRENFGRVAREVPYAVLREQVADQVGVLVDAARATGVQVSYVKAHGALYHRVVDDDEQAQAVLDGSGELPVLGMPGGRLLALAVEAGRDTATEGFPDRGYAEDGRLLERRLPGAVLEDSAAIATAALQMASLQTADRVDSLCLHGDTPGAVEHALRVRTALEAAGIVLRARFR